MKSYLGFYEMNVIDLFFGVKMNSNRFINALGIFCLIHSAFAFSLDTVSVEPKSQSIEETIAARLQKARPDMVFKDIHLSPVSGLYQAQIVGGPTIYVTPDAEKFIVGEVFSINPSGFAKYEDPNLIAERKKLLSGVNPKDSIIFKPAGKTKAVVYVFTDVDCGYCRKLNSQMFTYTEEGIKKSGYTDLGIEIRYLAYPRSGIPSISADKLVTAWCSSDRQKTLTMLKEDKPVDNKTCTNPVASEYELGAKLGVNGTPAMWMPTGELKPGYLPPDQLAKELGIL